MKVCEVCGSPEHPDWKAHVFVNTRKPSVNTLRKVVNTMQGISEKHGFHKPEQVGSTPAPATNATNATNDRHGDGYMRGYMAVRRALGSGRACRWPKGVG